ncbi:MAG: hypothetical protein ABIG87_01925 [Patescibacteria group bacterium]
MFPEIKWQALEYEYQQKTAEWFWAVWIIALGAAIASFLFNNILFGIFILLSAFSLSLFASRKPSLINFCLTKKGIRINEKLIPFSELQSFWIEENNSDQNKQAKILFRSQKKSSPYIIILLSENIDTDEIKEYLLRHLEEIEQHESVLQILIGRMGF